MNEIEEIISDLNEAVTALTSTASRLKQSARDAVEKRADYENKKNKYLIELAADDTKRTVLLQQAMYRKMFETERLQWQLSDRVYESDKDLFRGLQAKLNALQTIARLREGLLKIL